MISLSLSELTKIQEVCGETGVEYFTLSSSKESGIGRVLTMSYDTEIADYPAKIHVEISGVESW